MQYEIIALPKERWKGTAIPLTTRSDSYYDLALSPFSQEGCTISLVRKPAGAEIVHTPEEYDFPDSLYQDHWEGAEAYGVVSEAGEMLACVEVCPEEWSNRLMVTELWVSEALRGRGIGKRLMDKAKEEALRQNRRALILETQSCNTNAIGFYLHQGFELIGFYLLLHQQRHRPQRGPNQPRILFSPGRAQKVSPPGREVNQTNNGDAEGMKYAIELYFDQNTERELMKLAQLVADQHLSTKVLEWKTRPHLTLACFDDADERKCAAKLADFAQAHKPLPAYIGSVGMFTDTRTIFASPIMNSSMFEFQRALCEELAEFDSARYGWYHPDRWVPHCALALMGEDSEEAFYQACQLILRSFKKLSGQFAAIGLVRVSFPVEELFTARLGA